VTASVAPSLTTCVQLLNERNATCEVMRLHVVTWVERRQAIKIKEAQKLHLKTCRRVDTINSVIGHCHTCHQPCILQKTMARHQRSLLPATCTRNVWRARSVPRRKFIPKKSCAFMLSAIGCLLKGLNTHQSLGNTLVTEPREFTRKLNLKDRLKVFQEREICQQRKARRPAFDRVDEKHDFSWQGEHRHTGAIQNGKQNKTKPTQVFVGDFGHLSFHLETFC
jgi:hypothetical protein